MNNEHRQYMRMWLAHSSVRIVIVITAFTAEKFEVKK